MSKSVGYVDALKCEMGALKNVLNIKDWIKVGDIIGLDKNYLALEYDGDIPNVLDFKVIEKYNYVMLLEKPAAKRTTHRQSISYVKLYILLKEGAAWIRKGNYNAKS